MPDSKFCMQQGTVQKGGPFFQLPHAELSKPDGRGSICFANIDGAARRGHCRSEICNFRCTIYRMKTLVTLFLALVISVSAAAQTTVEKKRASAAILGVLNRQVAAWNEGDIDGFMRGYWRSPKLVFVSGDNITRGWQATIDRYKRTYDSREKMGTLSFSGLEIHVLSSGAATVLGSWSLQRANDNPHGKFTLVFRKFKEGWLVVQDHTS